MTKLLRAVLGGLMAMSVLGAAGAAQAAETGVVRFGIDPTYPPMDSKAPATRSAVACMRSASGSSWSSPA